jgi:hypothetical protein
MLNLNDMLYYTQIRNSAFSRKRIDYVDEHGIHWYRYDKPSWSYAIVPYRIVGYSKVTTTWVDSPLEVDIPESCYYLENCEIVDSSDVDNGYSWYSCTALAEANIADHKESINEL